MIKGLARSYFVSLIGLGIVSRYVGGFHLLYGLKSYLLTGLGLTFLHLGVTFLLDTILGSLNFLTLGLVGLGLDSGVIYALTIYFPQVAISAWHFSGLTVSGFSLPAYDFNVLATTVLAALIINVLRVFVSLLV